MMKRFLSLLLIVALLLGIGAAAPAQAPGQPANPGQTSAAQTGQANPDGGTSRGGSFEYIVAFAGAALALLVVCYPSRRY